VSIKQVRVHSTKQLCSQAVRPSACRINIENWQTNKTLTKTLEN
jgi:hypothetical protein